ncbi:hypothetical protein COCNU_scaffold006638G000010 [Cocos nucifera]|nr:hypothetical protein [Cocos nucifera]
MGSDLVGEGDRERERERLRDGKAGREALLSLPVIMVPKFHLAFTPAPRRVTYNSAFEEQSEHTPSTSTSTAQGPLSMASTPLMASTPPTAEPLSSSISEVQATMRASECASSSWTFHDPIRMAHVCNRQHQMMVYYDTEGRLVGETTWEINFFFEVLVRRSDIIPIEPRDWHLIDAAVRDRVWEEIWRRYDFSDHERARDA